MYVLCLYVRIRESISVCFGVDVASELIIVCVFILCCTVRVVDDVLDQCTSVISKVSQCECAFSGPISIES